MLLALSSSSRRNHDVYTCGRRHSRNMNFEVWSKGSCDYYDQSFRSTCLIHSSNQVPLNGGLQGQRQFEILRRTIIYSHKQYFQEFCQNFSSQSHTQKHFQGCDQSICSLQWLGGYKMYACGQLLQSHKLLISIGSFWTKSLQSDP